MGGGGASSKSSDIKAMEVSLSEDADSVVVKAWEVLQNGLQKIYETIKLEKLEKAVFTIVCQKQETTPLVGKLRVSSPLSVKEYMEIYQQLYQVYFPNGNSKKMELFFAMRDYLELMVIQCCERLENLSGVHLLDEYCRCWTAVVAMAHQTMKLTVFAHEHWIDPNSNSSSWDPIRPVDQLMLIIFRKQVEKKLPQVVDVALDLIDQDRRYKEIDHSLIQHVVISLVILGTGTLFQNSLNAEKDLYVELFEKKLLKRTRDFYHVEAAELMKDCTVPEYVAKVRRRLWMEGHRVYITFPDESNPPMKDTVEAELIGSQREFLQGDVERMIREDCREDLLAVYDLLSRIEDGLVPVKDTLRRYFTEQGVQIIASHAERLSDGKSEVKVGNSLMEELLRIHSMWSVMITECFKSDKLLQKALRESFCSFLNAKSFGRSSMAVVLARYGDYLMRKVIDKLLDEAIEEKLTCILQMFSYLQDKDLFVETYRRLLAKRLLAGSKYCDSSSELAVIEKLKQTGGQLYSSKLSGMFNDTDLSKETTARFKEWCASHEEHASNIDTSMQVLNSVYWPLAMKLRARVNESLQRRLDAFQKFYDERTTERRLEWMHAHSTVTLTANLKKRCEVRCNAIQATVLMMFNNTDAVDLKTVTEFMGVTEDEVNVHVNVLPMLSLHGTDGKKLKLDTSYESKLFRLVIPNVTDIVASKVGEEKVKRQVNQDRSFQVDAVLVRTMKSRVKLNHQELLSSAIDQLSRLFQPDVRFVKQRIDRLIDQDFMARDENDNNLYEYVA